MARNIEIKARITDIKKLTEKVAEIADYGPEELFQDDTFFHCPDGRLKLRTFSENAGQLIFYNRPDQTGPKESDYFISSTTEPDSLRTVLTRAYGEAGRVRKHRTLFIYGRTRIHLDRVEEIGDFLELEVVLEEGESSDTGTGIARELMKKLGIADSQLIDGAYVDLLKRCRSGSTPEPDTPAS